MRGTAARHAGFELGTSISDLSASELKALQRGGPRKPAATKCENRSSRKGGAQTVFNSTEEIVAKSGSADFRSPEEKVKDKSDSEVQTVELQTKEVGVNTLPSPMWEVVTMDTRQPEEFVAEANNDEAKLREVVARAWRLHGVEPGISHVRCKYNSACSRVELMVTCSRTREALGVKGATINAVTPTIRDAIGRPDVEIFVQGA